MGRWRCDQPHVTTARARAGGDSHCCTAVAASIERLYGSTDCARRREEEERTASEASVCGGFSGAAYAGSCAVPAAAGGWCGIRTAKHGVSCHACPPQAGAVTVAILQGWIRKKPVPMGRKHQSRLLRDSVTRNICVQTSPASRSARSRAQANSSMMFHSQ